MRDRIFSGANIEEALDAACRALDAAPDELTYIVIEEQSAAAFRQTEGTARIAVFEGADRRPADRTATLSPAALISKALRALSHASGVSLTASVSQNGELLEVSLFVEDDEFFWGAEGEVFDALELILRRMIFRAGYRGPVRVTNNSVIVRRQERIKMRARDAATRAREEGAPLVLSGLSSFERRIVHLTLAGEKEVRTRSEGEAGQRRLIIEPVVREE
ncbi:MAG: Jag N-terminal domain-containing protein [Vicinamibacteria bacterium]|nr:Jag N-terminal domain-containing protein [Vicinamibacteria bacterium]